MKMIPVSFESQILPGSFEYSLSYLVDQELDLTAFDEQYRNDDGVDPLIHAVSGYEKDCQSYALRKCCLRDERQLTPSQINVALDITQEQKVGIIERMKHKIDSPWGRHIYSQRLGTVEPVFGHITDAIGIKRFSLRGKQKVDGQWKLMMMLHNILEVHRYGWEWA